MLSGVNERHIYKLEEDLEKEHKEREMLNRELNSLKDLQIESRRQLEKANKQNVKLTTDLKKNEELIA